MLSLRHLWALKALVTIGVRRENLKTLSDPRRVRALASRYCVNSAGR